MSQLHSCILGACGVASSARQHNCLRPVSGIVRCSCVYDRKDASPYCGVRAVLVLKGVLVVSDGLGSTKSVDLA